MSRLLNFTPEPFDDELIAVPAFSEWDIASTDTEEEGELGRGRSRSFRARAFKPARPQRQKQPRLFRHPKRVPRWPLVRPTWPVPYPTGPWYPPEPPEPQDGTRVPDLPELPSEHVRWVQQCLNRFLGLRLPLDGIASPQTRSAIRMFQERRGLPITVLAGPETEAALTGACRGPGGTSSPVPTEGELDARAGSRRQAPSRQAAASTPTTAFDGAAFRRKIVQLAGEELARWGNGAIKETDPRTRKVLQDYWKTGAQARFTEAQLGDPAFHADHPWSAAFISWVIRRAGAGDAFKYSSSHATYTRAAIDNRLASSTNPFKAYRVTELAPQVGDIVCKARAGSGATYDKVRPGMKTHCDIVTAVRPGWLLSVGGNVGNSVKATPVRTHPDGRIAEPGYFAVIRIGGAQPSVPTGPSPRPATHGAGARDTRWIQGALNRVLGLRLVVDGIVGPATRSAVRTFQRKHGLTVDGIVGPRTQAAMIAAAPRPHEPQKERSMRNVRLIRSEPFNFEFESDTFETGLEQFAEEFEKFETALDETIQDEVKLSKMPTARCQLPPGGTMPSRGTFSAPSRDGTR